MHAFKIVPLQTLLLGGQQTKSFGLLDWDGGFDSRSCRLVRMSEWVSRETIVAYELYVCMVEPLQQTPKEPILFFILFECACQSQKVTYLLFIPLTLCADVYGVWDATKQRKWIALLYSCSPRKVSTRAGA